MNPLIQLKTTTLPLLITFVLNCFALLPAARAVVPAPDGGYLNGNTAEGGDALFSLTTGRDNTAMGFQALHSNTNGSANTAVGAGALYSNIGGIFLGAHENTAVGWHALFSNTGLANTATGSAALQSNTGGWGNTATGREALASNTTASFNTGNGLNTLAHNTIGEHNTATGVNALGANTTGNSNTADGYGALFNSTVGSGNIALGLNAGFNLTTGDNNIDIGNQAVAGEANTIRIGTQGTQTRTFIAGISGTTLVNGVAVRVNANGQLGTLTSSARFKDDIKPMDKASESILALKPVTFRYKKEIDPKGLPQFGLVAEEVEKVNPALVARDSQGKVYTVRYEAVNAMLLNEFLKEHRAFVEEQRKVEAQEATITQLKSTVAQQQKDFQAIAANQQKQIEALSAGLQKVSAQLEATKAAPQVVNNP